MRQFGRLMVLAGLLAMAPACQSGSSGDAASKSVEAGSRTFTVAFVTNSASDFWTIARRGVEKADNELNDVSAEFRITSDGSSAEQRRIIDDLLTKGVDAIIVPTMVVNKANVEEFTKRINDLRGR